MSDHLQKVIAVMHMTVTCILTCRFRVMATPVQTKTPVWTDGRCCGYTFLFMKP